MEMWAIPAKPDADAWLRAFALGAAYADPKHAGVTVGTLYTGIFSPNELPLVAALVDPASIKEAKDRLGLVSNTSDPLLGLVLEKLMVTAAKKRQEDFAAECAEKSKTLNPEEFAKWLKQHGMLTK